MWQAGELVDQQVASVWELLWIIQAQKALDVTLTQTLFLTPYDRLETWWTGKRHLLDTCEWQGDEAERESRFEEECEKVLMQTYMNVNKVVDYLPQVKFMDRTRDGIPSIWRFPFLSKWDGGFSGNIQTCYGWDGKFSKNNPDPSIFRAFPVIWTELPKINPIPAVDARWSQSQSKNGRFLSSFWLPQCMVKSRQDMELI